jgi:virginiamycin A acetyltransferase
LRPRVQLNRALRFAHRLLHGARAWQLRRSGVRLGKGARVGLGSKLTSRTTIGPYTVINGRASVRGAGRAEIGAYCAIARDFRVFTSNHSTHHPNMQYNVQFRHGFPGLAKPADVSIGSACWIGDRVTVLPGARIGCGAVVGAGALVAGEIEPFTIVGGVPAKQLKRRCEADVAAALQEIAWWDWPEDRIARNREFFECDIATVSAAELRALVGD